MIAFRCEREDELLDALADGRWPDAAGTELNEHVESCDECRDLAVVASAMIDDRREAESHADLPTSGAMWWRMQLRMEREAKDEAAKTVGRVHGAVVGVTIAAMTLVLLATSVVKMGWKWLESALPHASDFAGLPTSLPLTFAVLVGVALLVFAPVAVYLAVAKE